MSLQHIVSASLRLMLFLFAFLLLSGNHPAHADYYKYTDRNGAVCISNRLDAVPPQYRSTMKVISEGALEKRDKSTRLGTPHRDAPMPETTSSAEAPKDAAPASPPTAAGPLFSRFPWLSPLLFVGAAILLFGIVRKLSEFLPSPLLARVIYLAFFLGVFVFAYKCYADHVAESYATIKTRILALFEKANRREMPEQSEKRDGQLSERN